MSDVFARRRVVVTGGAGFLGSFVVEKLRQRGCQQVFVPRSADYDLTRMEAVERLYRDARPDLVIHLAARVGGIGDNQKNPGRYFYDNLMMGVQLIEVGRRVGLPKLVATGTICAYPKHARVPFREEDLWEGYPEETNAPYGLAKKMLLVQAQAYRKQYGMNAVVVFPVNLYGPRDNFDLETSHVVPAIIRKIDMAMRQGRQEVELWGDGTPTREFLYVEDAAEAVLLAAEHYDDSEPINLGSGREISIAELASLVGSLMGYGGRFVYDPSRPNGQMRRAVDTRRARERLGFVARTSLEEGLRRTIAWWREHGARLEGR
ncbi:MAG: GDP-L-fucose synthase [Myxococcales bacterium]|nr:GDP-L-fucose synthase [Myxococcota bacterium]MDW8281195.1 GDP-L-fucose synthase [Myxococcales bacterium]